MDKNTKILVTGGTGFAGSHLIEELLAQGYTNIWSTTFSRVDSALLPADHYVQVNLTDEDATKTMFSNIQPQAIFHLASFAYVGKSFDKAKELFENNISLQLSILNAVRDTAPSARILTIGSAEEYGIVDQAIEEIDESVALHPINPYAVSKVTQDLLAGSYQLSFKLQIIRARPFNHIGTRQTGDFAIPSFAAQVVAIENGKQEKLLVGNLSGIRDFTSVSDMVKAYILLMEKGEVGEIYNIGSGRGYAMTEIVEILKKLAKVPIQLQEDAARMRPLDVGRLVADNRKIVSLGWQPTMDIQNELQNVLEEWRKKVV
ncbi:MAG TPA: GDP-mannose 4,6-dehydratase [Patescibacteria group bacterium]|nr:GDP-mannose 4,6-dehydratase [Patescibacteria group bacterium]